LNLKYLLSLHALAATAPV